jgi:hypothetical protein
MFRRSSDVYLKRTVGCIDAQVRLVKFGAFGLPERKCVTRSRGCSKDYQAVASTLSPSLICINEGGVAISIHCDIFAKHGG